MKSADKPALESDEKKNQTPAIDSTVCEPGAWTLEMMQQQSIQSNPAILERWAMIQAGRGQLVQAGLTPNPMVGFEGQQLASAGRAEQYGITYGREIVHASKLAANQRLAESQLRQLERELQVMQWRVQTDVRIAFFDHLASRQQVELTKELVKLAEKASEMANQLLEAKEVSKIDVLQAKVEFENTAILAENALHRFQSSWQNLAALTNLPVDCPLSVCGQIDRSETIDPFCQLVDHLRACSPEVHAAAARVEQLRYALGRERVETNPNVSVQGIFNWRDNGTQGDPNAGLAVSVPLPLRNKNQGAIQRAIGDLHAAQQALAKLELALQQRLASTYERYSNAKRQSDRYRESILPAASDSLELTRLAYRNGEASFIGLLTAQRTYFTISLSALEAKRELRKAEAEILGYLLTESLQQRTN